MKQSCQSGTWAKVGSGGNFRPGANWVDQSTSRAIDTTYYNNSGYFIQLAITTVATHNMFCGLFVNNIFIGFTQFTPSGGGGTSQMTGIVPNGSSYAVRNLGGNGCGGGIITWGELI